MGKKPRKEKRRRERRETREERLEKSRKETRGRKRKKFLSFVVLGVAIVAVGYGVYAWFSRDLPGESHPSQGNRHVPASSAEIFPYNTNPPTSGPHYASLARWGIHKKPIPKGLQVHNLEDGGVVVQYRCLDCPDLIEKIEKIVSRYATQVVVAPYTNMKPLIALTAWTRVDRLEAFNEKRIVRFIEAYRGIDHHR